MKLRSSQINGCLYCCDMHTRDARLAGVSERKLAQLPAADLTLLVGTINLWNRLSIGTRAQPPAAWPKLP